MEATTLTFAKDLIDSGIVRASVAQTQNSLQRFSLLLMVPRVVIEMIAMLIAVELGTDASSFVDLKL